MALVIERLEQALEELSTFLELNQNLRRELEEAAPQVAAEKGQV